MSSLSEINFNYEQAMRQAGELEDIARQLTKASSNTMQGIINDVYRAWKSDSTPQYIKKGEKIGNDMRITAGNLNNIASAIRTIARRIRDAELDAWRIANERTS